ncbi:MAG: type II toxin-antitoxin system RelE/ParE family toxin [Alcanivoracaceae bacterium]|jgi:proteic killer suppression protein|nr:type II toxin-antitoxin system RelE/ParE family toxin [Alcanivoracaceae bacterium]
MIRSFRHKGLQRFFESGKTSGIQSAHAKKLRLILGRLHASAEVGDMDLPGLHLHQLKGRQKKRWSVRVSGNWRVTFGFEKPDTLDVDYEDYH